jgi:hypothetical protein
MTNFLDHGKQVDIIDRFQEQNYWHEVMIIDSIGFKIKDHLKTIFVGGIQTYKKATRFTGKNFGYFFDHLNFIISPTNTLNEKWEKFEYAIDTLDMIKDMFTFASNWKWYQYDTRSKDSVNYTIAHILVGQLYERVYKMVDGPFDYMSTGKLTDIKLKDSYLVLLAMDEYIVDPDEYFPEDVLLDFI